MTCRMFGDKPQPGQIMTRSQLDFRIKFHSKLSLKRIHLKVVSAGGDYHDIGLNVLRHISHHFYEQGSCDVYLYRINHFSWVFKKTICIYLLSTIIVTDRIERLTKQSMPCVVYTLTLNVRGQSYLGLTRSISWLLMPWLLTSTGHQQLWYWLCRKSSFLSYLRKDFNYLRRINMEKWHQM